MARVQDFIHVDGGRVAIDLDKVDAMTERFDVRGHECAVDIETSGTRTLVLNTFEACFTVWKGEQ